MVRVVLTGGGTAGHVMPHIAMLPYYRREGWDCIYIGSGGIESQLAAENRIEFHKIQTGKLRRYFSLDNFIDIFRIVFGFFQSLYLLGRLRPQLVFSKGGFVSVPVAYAAWCLGIPVVTHESDLTPGLANKLIKPVCKVTFCAFQETIKYFAPGKAIEVGIPVREGLFLGTLSVGRELCGFLNDECKTLLVMGGSSGAERINRALESVLPTLTLSYNVIHITGKGKRIEFSSPRYKSFEFISDELPHVLALADVVVTRSGANSIFEMLSLRKPMLLIPLEIASRGDQVDNAMSFLKRGWARVLRENELNSSNLTEEINKLFDSADSLKASMRMGLSEILPHDLIMKQLKSILEKHSKLA